nr:MAG TPA: hypothetical protein [Caudoviricetes sp.]
MSLSPPMEIALRIESSKSVDSRKATIACGTVSWQDSLNR